MTSIDSRRGETFSDIESAREEIKRLRAELAEWRRKFDAAPKRDIAFTNSAEELIEWSGLWIGIAYLVTGAQDCDGMGI